MTSALPGMKVKAKHIMSVSFFWLWMLALSGRSNLCRPVPGGSGQLQGSGKAHKGSCAADGLP